jgi:hypothetical protein
MGHVEGEVLQNQQNNLMISSISFEPNSLKYSVQCYHWNETNCNKFQIKTTLLCHVIKTTLLCHVILPTSGVQSQISMFIYLEIDVKQKTVLTSCWDNTCFWWEVVSVFGN